MKILYLAIIAISFTLVSIFTHNAFASVELNAYMATNGHPVTPIFKFSKSVLIDYPSGSQLQKELDGKNVTVEFTDDSDHNPSIRSFMQQLNMDIANERRTSGMTNLTIRYEAMIHGDDKQATIDYLLTLKPTLVNYVINSGSASSPTVLDASWTGFSIKDPVIITTQQYGNLEINFPLGVIQNQLPDVYSALKGTPAEEAMSDNIVDASSLVSYPIEKWNTIFDPAYTLSETAGYGYSGQKVAVTGFAYGQSDLYQGSLKTQNKEIDFTTDAKYHLTTIEKTSTGTIDVDGHANGYSVQGMPAISTTFATDSYITCCPVIWYDRIPGLVWVGLVGAAVVGFWVFYFRRFKG